VEELGFPDRHHLLAADGWVDLGNALEAMRDLARISRIGRQHPDVLETRWRVLAKLDRWAEALLVACDVVAAAPTRASGWIHRSYTLHELRRTGEALECLLPAAAQFPAEPIIPYNLACYACQLGDVARAEHWLRQAADLRGREAIKQMAKQDSDLAPLTEFLGML
jgi:predicted Zn-dependent protease